MTTQTRQQELDELERQADDLRADARVNMLQVAAYPEWSRPALRAAYQLQIELAVYVKGLIRKARAQ